jgi:uncharacterized protein (TIGR00369 family)
MTEALFQRVQASFDRQGTMALIGARLAHVALGEVDITLDFRAEVSQQHGFFHGGIIATLLDTACGYAAYSHMGEADGVLTVELKTSFLTAAAGPWLRAEGRVRRAGRTLTFCEGSAYVGHGDAARLVATMSATMMRLQDRAGVVG